MNQTVATVEAVTSKEGATNGKAWKKFTVKTEDGTTYSTFDAAIAQTAHGLIGKPADVTWKPSGNEGQFKDLIMVAPAENPGPDASGIPSARDANGEADWDVIGLRKTRCLLWAEFLGSPLAAAIPAGESGGRADAIYRVGTVLVELAERDIYWREPATKESDLPF